MDSAKNPQPMADKIALRIPEAAHISGLSRSTLYKLIGEGKLRSVKAAGRRLIMREDLESFFAHHRSGAGR